MSLHHKIDYHNHTSEDTVDNVQHSAIELVQKAAELQYTSIAITSHRTQVNIDSAIALGKDLGVFVISGVEFSIEGKHIIGLGFSSRDANSIKSISDLRSAKKEYGLECFIIAPHPFYIVSGSMNSKLFEWANIFDAVEITRINTRLTTYFNNRAKTAAKKLGLPILANSDSHGLHDFGTTYSVITSEYTNPFQAIRSGDIQTVCPPLRELTMLRLILNMYAHKLVPYQPKVTRK